MNEFVNNLDRELKAGQKITIFAISEGMAHTVKSEVTIVDRTAPEFRPDYVAAMRGKHRLGTYKQRGKRKLYYLDLRHDVLIFDGWDLPFKTDGEIPSDGISFSGNACYNLAGDREVIRDWIENRLLSGEASDEVKAKIVIVEVDGRGWRAKGHADRESLLYPDVESRSAVVNRLQETRREVA
jgi:hypothetical protein